MLKFIQPIFLENNDFFSLMLNCASHPIFLFCLVNAFLNVYFLRWKKYIDFFKTACPLNCEVCNITDGEKTKCTVCKEKFYEEDGKCESECKNYGTTGVCFINGFPSGEMPCELRLWNGSQASKRECISS